MRKVILRTPEEKADVRLSWSRPDEEFFASGACHILAGAFLLAHPDAGFRPWSIRPKAGHRGGHLVVRRVHVVFDWSGFAGVGTFLDEYRQAMRVVNPDWDAEFHEERTDPLGWEYCRRTGSRHPSQFFRDPLPRAIAFVRKFRPPG